MATRLSGCVVLMDVHHESTFFAVTAPPHPHNFADLNQTDATQQRHDRMRLTTSMGR